MSAARSDSEDPRTRETTVDSDGELFAELYHDALNEDELEEEEEDSDYEEEDENDMEQDIFEEDDEFHDAEEGEEEDGNEVEFEVVVEGEDGATTANGAAAARLLNLIAGKFSRVVDIIR